MTFVLLLAVGATIIVWWHQRWHAASGRAGGSAAARAGRLRTPLVRLTALVGIGTARGREADQWEAGAAGERRTAARLDPLRGAGWTVLHDRALPGSRANVDHVVVSPSGVVVVVDSKLWCARHRLRAVGGRLLHGDCDVTDRLAGIRHEAAAVARILGCPAAPLVSMDGPPIEGGELLLDGVLIVAADRVVAALQHFGQRRLDGPHPGPRAARLLTPYGRNPR